MKSTKTYAEEMGPQSADRVFGNVRRQLADSRTEPKYANLTIRVIDPRWYAVSE